MPEDTPTLRVKAADPTKVGLFDKNPAHPPNDYNPDGGEVFVTGEDVVEVADVSEVRQAIREGRLVEVSARNAEASGATEPPKSGRR